MPDRERWAQLSAELDALLALTQPGRAMALSAIRARNAGLAEDLDALLLALTKAASERFLEGNALGGAGPG